VVDTTTVVVSEREPLDTIALEQRKVMKEMDKILDEKKKKK